MTSTGYKRGLANRPLWLSRAQLAISSSICGTAPASSSVSLPCATRRIAEDRGDDLEATGPSRTTVTLTYDWSAVPPLATTDGRTRFCQRAYRT